MSRRWHRQTLQPGGMVMATQYVRRFRMEFDLLAQRVPAPSLPLGYHWVAWHPRLQERHAAVKHESFQFEIDSQVFPCLGTLDGCRSLMNEIARQHSFLPAATWLITYRDLDIPPAGQPVIDCGTIQGMIPAISVGAVQNVGIAPAHRGLGLGRALVLKALHGFRRAGLDRVFLEVTADNTPAVELYQSIGFRLKRTMFKAVELESAAFA
jgi:ribosomal protein S18 acetylase RimI-like enzyme